MGVVIAATVFLALMTILGGIIEGAAAYRAHRQHQWARRYVKQIKTTGLRRPARKA